MGSQLKTIVKTICEFKKSVEMEKDETDPGKKSAQQEAEDMFRIYDKNKDGFISHDELKEVLSELDSNFTDIEIKEMMDTFDTDGDGQ